MSHLQLFDAKFYMELSYYLWPLPPVPCFARLARLPAGTCCPVCVLWVTSPGADAQSGPPSLLGPVIVNVPTLFLLQDQQKIFTQLFLCVRKCLQAFGSFGFASRHMRNRATNTNLFTISYFLQRISIYRKTNASQDCWWVLQKFLIFLSGSDGKTICVNIPTIVICKPCFPKEFN